LNDNKKKPKPTYAQLQNELKMAKSRCFWDSMIKLVQPVVKWSGLVAIAYFATFAIHDLSGKITNASIGIKAEAALNPSDDGDQSPKNPEWPYWIAALSAILATASISYGLNQRQLRKDTIQNLSPYKEKWESYIDPGRTSSGLTPNGSTNPIDR